ncbi:hypothetical protein QVD17_08962 [Tagetes erecta]|uniref:Integrase catalytic domain-containing protein n=1 Tax=Tagetes erecta TaxID=13708 RepID=A0AAD8L532_TARER|nr:hypothetical protein QVD17_08962 [Tagetes erecta]
MILMCAPRKNDTYLLDMNSKESTSSVTCLLSKASSSEAFLWHRKLGHVNFDNINKLVKHNLVRGLPIKDFSVVEKCMACAKGKQHKKSHKSKMINSISCPLELLHADLFGPISVKSIAKKSYCLVVTDDFSRYYWVCFLSNKGETAGTFKSLFLKIETISGKKVKAIRSDNGTEFQNHIFDSFCEEKGILRQYSAAQTPQQNGVAERKNRTLVETARTMLIESKLPIIFWAEAVNCASYVLNRVLIVKAKMKASYELFHKRKPLIDFFRPFGCSCTLLNTQAQTSKFGAVSDECFFVGYSSSQKAYRVYNRRTKIVQESFYVDWQESNVCDTVSEPSWFYDATIVFNSFNLPLFLEEDDIVLVYSEVIPDSATFSPSPTISQPLPPTLDVVIPTDPSSSSPPPASPVIPLDPSTITISDISTSNSLYKELKDHPHDLVMGSISDGVRTRHQSGLINVCLFSCFLSQIVPKNINIALQDPSWVELMQLELQQFRKLKVWELVDLPPNKYTIGTKWVYKNKPDDRGVVVRNKARLVVQGFAQEDDIDYTDVFAPVARIEAIRIFLAHAAHKTSKFIKWM